MLGDAIQKPVIILGMGGHAKVVANTLIESGRNILGFVGPDAVKGEHFAGFDVLGDDNDIGSFFSDEIVLANGVGSLPAQMRRWNVAYKLRQQGYKFTTVVHPSAVIAENVQLSEGVQVMAGAIIQPGVIIGQHTIINTGVLLDHDCIISANCHLAPGVVCSGDVVIGKGSHIGTASSVVQGINIGDNVIVAAGSVVFKDIKQNQTLIQKVSNNA